MVSVLVREGHGVANMVRGCSAGRGGRGGRGGLRRPLAGLLGGWGSPQERLHPPSPSLSLWLSPLYQNATGPFSQTAGVRRTVGLRGEAEPVPASRGKRCSSHLPGAAHRVRGSDKAREKDAGWLLKAGHKLPKYPCAAEAKNGFHVFKWGKKKSKEEHYFVVSDNYVEFKLQCP